MSTVNPPTDADEKKWPDYLPDRYDRLKGGAHEYATGADFGDNFIDGEMIECLAENLTTARVLDGLTEHDADTVALLTVLDFPRGLRHMAWRLTDWMSDNRTVNRPDDDEFAVISVLARVLAIVAAAVVGEEFEIAQQHYCVGEVVTRRRSAVKYGPVTANVMRHCEPIFDELHPSRNCWKVWHEIDLEIDTAGFDGDELEAWRAHDDDRDGAIRRAEYLVSHYERTGR